jgi:hypothetical protein
MNQKSKYFTPKRAKVREQALIYKKKTQFSHSCRLEPSDLKCVAEIVYNNFITASIRTVKSLINNYHLILYGIACCNYNGQSRSQL